MTASNEKQPEPFNADRVDHAREEARVRVTADLPKSLHRKLKQAAFELNQPMTELVRQVLAEQCSLSDSPDTDCSQQTHHSTLMSSPKNNSPELLPSDQEPTAPRPDSSESLRQQGLIRVHGKISIKFNERIKAMAREQGRNADQLIGELIEASAHIVDQYDAAKHATKLKELLGSNWLQILRSADATQDNSQA